MKKVVGLLLVIVLVCTTCACGKEKTVTDKVEEDGIRVYSLMLSPEGDIRQYVINKFENMYPGHKIHWETGVSEENGITVQDAIRKLNADMMAGKGPDVILLDGLSISDYVDKGMLEDISRILEELRNDGEIFFENVLAAYEKDGKICAVPSMFSVPIIVGDEEIVRPETFHELTKVIEKRANDSIPVLSEYFVGELPLIFLTEWTNMFTENQTVDKEVLTTFLEDMKKMTEISGFDKDLPEYESYSPFEVNPIWETMIGGPLPGIIWEEYQMVTGSLRMPFDCYSIKSAGKRKAIHYDYLNRKSGNMFQPKFTIGMNASSEKKKEAETFIKFFLSSDFMSAPVASDYYVSVNKKCFERNLPTSEEEKEIGWTSNSDTHEEATDAEKLYYYELNPQEAQDFLTFLGKADTMIDVDYSILQSVMELVEDYIYEEETLEDTVNRIAGKVEIYQAE